MTPTTVGDNTYSISCDTAKTVAHVNALSQYTAIPDPTLQAALKSFGFDVTNGLIKTSDALKITQLTISTLITDCANGVTITNPQTQFCFKPASSVVQDTTGLENFINLDHLTLDGQQFKSINLRPLNKLAYLSLRQGPITKIDLSQNGQITTLGLGETSLTAADLSALTALTELDIPNIKPVPYTAANGTQVAGFDSLDLSKNVNLVTVSAEFNRLTLLNTSHNLSLNSIRVFNNQITAIDFSKNTKLQYIWVNDNNLYYLNISGINNGSVPSILMAFDNQDLWQIQTSQPAAMAAFAVSAPVVNAVRIFVSNYEPHYAGNDSAISSYTIFIQGT